MILWLNGTYGVGKTSVAYALTKLYSGNSKVIDPDILWLNTIKKDNSIIFGDGAYPQNNIKFLNTLNKVIKENIDNYTGLLIIPMSITEDLSYNKVIKNHKNNIIHIVLLADEDIVKKRITKDKNRDQSFSIISLKENNNFLKNRTSDTIYVDTSNMSIKEVAVYINNNILRS